MRPFERSLILLTMAAMLSQAQRDPMQLLRGGQPQQALTVIDDLLQHGHANDPRLLTLRGVALTQLGNAQGALASFRDALAQTPDYVAALEGAAQIEYGARSPQAALHLHRLVQLRPGDATAHAMLGSIEARDGNCPVAVNDFQAATPLVEANPEALQLEAACLFHLERWREAAAAFTKLLAMKPGDTKAALGAASAQIKTGDPEKAVETLAPFPTDSRALSLKAVALERLNKVPEAVTALRAAIVLDPAREGLYSQFAELCFTYKSYQAGIDMINVGLTKLPGSATLYLLRGILLVQQGNYDRADKDFAQAQTLDPKEPINADAAVLSLVQANRLNEAQSLVEQKLKDHPNDAQLLYFLADILNRNSETAKSMAAVKRALVLRPDFALAHDLLSRLYFEQGNFSAAEKECQAALRYDPGDESSLYRWIRIVKARNSKADAVLLRELSARWMRTRQERQDDEFRQSQFRIVTHKPGEP